MGKSENQPFAGLDLGYVRAAINELSPP